MLMERGVCSCAELQVRRSARFQQHRDASCQQIFFLKGKGRKEIQTILIETLGKNGPLYTTVKNLVAHIKHDFSARNAACPRRPKNFDHPGDY